MSEPTSHRVSEPPPRDTSPRRPPAPDSDLRHTLERIVGELLRKGVDAGRGSFERMGESLSPKEIAAGVFAQIGDLRSGIVRAVAQEVGAFLREANVAEEIRSVLDGLGIDAKIELRYKDGTLTGEATRRKPRARAQRG